MLQFPITFEQFRALADAWEEDTMGQARNGWKCPLHVAIERLIGQDWRIERDISYPRQPGSPSSWDDAATPAWARVLVAWVDLSPAGPVETRRVRRLAAKMAEARSSWHEPKRS